MLFKFNKAPFSPYTEPRLTEPSFHNVLYSALPLGHLNAFRMNVRHGGMLDKQAQVIQDHHDQLVKRVNPGDTRAAQLPAWRQHNPTRGFGNTRTQGAAGGAPAKLLRR